MDALLNSMGIAMAVCIVLMLGTACMAGAFGFVTICEKLYIRFKIANFAPTTAPADEIARQHMKNIREQQDRERRERVVRRSLLQKQEMLRGEILPTVVAAPPPEYILTNASKKSFFYGIRFGHHGTNEPKILFTPIRSLARHMPLSETLRMWNLLDRTHRTLTPELAVGSSEPEQPEFVQEEVEFDITNEIPTTEGSNDDERRSATGGAIEGAAFAE